MQRCALCICWNDFVLRRESNKAGSRDMTKCATCFLSVRLETQPVRMLLSKPGDAVSWEPVVALSCVPDVSIREKQRGGPNVADRRGPGSCFA